MKPIKMASGTRDYALKPRPLHIFVHLPSPSARWKGVEYNLCVRHFFFLSVLPTTSRVATRVGQFFTNYASNDVIPLLVVPFGVGILNI